MDASLLAVVALIEAARNTNRDEAKSAWQHVIDRSIWLGNNLEVVGSERGLDEALRIINNTQASDRGCW